MIVIRMRGLLVIIFWLFISFIVGVLNPCDNFDNL